MALVLTLMRWTEPSITARTVWMLGLNLRLERPVIFVPTPPRYLALPRVVFLRPNWVFLPVKWQTRGIGSTSMWRSKGAGSIRTGEGECKWAGRSAREWGRVSGGF